VALNRALTAAVARRMAVPERFLEVVIAPGVEPEAAAVFSADGAPKWGRSLRILDAGTARTPAFGLDVRSVDGGLLVQTRDRDAFAPGAPTVATKRAPSEREARDLVFAWLVAKHVRSNAIVFAKDRRAVGVGAGQMSRVEAVEIALRRARTFAAETGTALEGMVMASDAFFPFNDALEAGLDAGASAVIQPGGSRNDPQAIQLCEERGAAMWLAGHRHFRH
jgi:phosphoribosylaminoimidazolecarboxamide formyltransferase/IMP cyclohydrolase